MGEDNRAIEDALGELAAYKVERTGLMVSEEYQKITTLQINCMKALFDRQHKDVQQLTKSSKKLEKLTIALIAFTAVLTSVEVRNLIDGFLHW